MRPICAICAKEIAEADDSDEHIINQAIGGRRTVAGLLHRACNNGAGGTWDKELAKQLQPLSLHFDVRRQRGSVPSMRIITTAGEELLMGPKGRLARTAKPDIKTTPAPGGRKNLFATVGSMQEARRLLEGLKRKNPEIDVEAQLANAEVQRAYPQGVVKLQLGFPDGPAARSLVKSTLALAHEAGIPVDCCGEALGFLRQADAVPCFGPYFTGDLVDGRPAEVPLHCVAIEANPETGLILGYAEHFGFHRAVICLGRAYSGAAVKRVYALDPRTGDELDFVVRLDFNAADIAAIYDQQMDDIAARQAAFGAVFGPALRAQHEAERARVLKEAVAYGWANCGATAGEMLTEAHIAKLSRLIAERMMPFLLRAAGGRDRLAAQMQATALAEAIARTA